MKMLGEKLGAIDLPDTYAGTERAIKQYIPELHYGDRAKNIIGMLDNFPSNLSAKPFVKMISRAGFQPVHLAEINFHALYEQRMAQAGQAEASNDSGIILPN